MAKKPTEAAVLSALEKLRANETKAQRLALDRYRGTSSLAGWFIGPLAENADLMEKLAVRAVQGNADARRSYAAQFGDPPYVTDAIKAASDYTDTVDALERQLDQMLGQLHGSIPLSSYRNQSHMYWDCTLPGFIGYFAAMLYNQNNVAAEASPVTTLYEIEVGRDLCRMLGYTVPEGDTNPSGTPVPWGHISCDGSVANAESIWAARNLKYLPVSLANALLEVPELAPAKGMKVTLLDGSQAALTDLDEWSLLNLGIDSVIE